MEAESVDGLQDVVVGPDLSEGPELLVMNCDESLDLSFQSFGRTVDTAFDLFFGDMNKKTAPPDRGRVTVSFRTFKTEDVIEKKWNEASLKAELKHEAMRLALSSNLLRKHITQDLRSESSRLKRWIYVRRS